MSRIILDTGVIAEYIDLTGRLHRQAEAVIESIITGRLSAVVPHPTLAETFYVSLRIYEKLRLDDPEHRAEELATWLYRSPNFTVAEPSLHLALLAGRIKTSFHLALTDAYVIAASKLYKGKAVFRGREMAKSLTELEKNYDLVFLEDYKR